MRLILNYQFRFGLIIILIQRNSLAALPNLNNKNEWGQN